MADAQPPDKGCGQRLHRRGIDLETNPPQRGHRRAHCKLVNEGSEIKYDTLLSIINQHDRIIRGAVCDGYSVLTGVAQFSPRVTGNWLGKSANFDPSTNKLTLDMVLSKEMRDALATVGVEVLGVKEGGGIFRAARRGDGDRAQGGPPPDAEQPVEYYCPRACRPGAGGIHPADCDAVL